MGESFAAAPAARFPAYLAFARVQAPHYESYSTKANGGLYGSGRYSIFTTREVEDQADLDRITRLHDVGGITGLSRLLLPPQLESDRELREAAARLKADMLVLYTFDTSFFDKDLSRPLAVLTLGISPTRRVHVHVTASALVMDTRTGFIYATLETSEKRELLSSILGEGDNVDTARRDAEKVAFKKLVDEFEKNWLLIEDRAKQGA